MFRTTAVIIGAGQAGLAVSYLLTAASVDHVVLERGRTGESWRSRRWDSLRLLTPNWMSRLPGWSYRGNDPAGYLPAGSVAAYLSAYADSFRAPVIAGADVRSVRRHQGRYLIDTDAGCWSADCVVIATGYCDRPAVPRIARDLDPSILQLTPDRYHNPAHVPDGAVLVVGASATGTQLADELAAAGRDVTLAVGRHTRMPRRYRGKDIMWWLDGMGLLERRVTPDDLRRPEPSLQLAGRADGREVDLPSLSARGVRTTGRVSRVTHAEVVLAEDLPITTAQADARLDRLLHRIDDFAAATGLTAEVDSPTRPAPSTPALRSLPPTRLDLHAQDIRTVIWATGYRRHYPWLQVPVLDATGDIRHTSGRTPSPGMMVVGMRWQTRRNSTFLDGVRHDAAHVVDHLINEVLVGPGTRRRAS